MSDMNKTYNELISMAQNLDITPDEINQADAAAANHARSYLAAKGDVPLAELDLRVLLSTAAFVAGLLHKAKTGSMPTSSYQDAHGYQIN